MSGYSVGDKVTYRDKEGIVAYVGKIKEKKGTWVGICVTKGKGSNDGSYKGTKYFECKDKKGLFVNASSPNLRLVGETKNAKDAGVAGKPAKTAQRTTEKRLKIPKSVAEKRRLSVKLRKPIPLHSKENPPVRRSPAPTATSTKGKPPRILKTSRQSSSPNLLKKKSRETKIEELGKYVEKLSTKSKKLNEKARQIEDNLKIIERIETLKSENKSLKATREKREVLQEREKILTKELEEISKVNQETLEYLNFKVGVANSIVEEIMNEIDIGNEMMKKISILEAMLKSIE